MIRRFLAGLLALAALAAAPAHAKDELVVAMTQMPGTWNPVISSMLAKSLIANMTARPLTAYDADWKLVCLACTELPTVENGKARVIDLPDGKKGMEIDVELRDLRWGDGMPVTSKDVAFTLEVGKHPLSGVASSEGYKRVLKLDIKDDRRFTMTIDRVTFDYNSCGRVHFSTYNTEPNGTVNDPDRWPNNCKANFTPQERLLEYLFFNIASCVQGPG